MILALINFCLFTAVNDALFDEANRLYTEGRYTEALMRYVKLIEEYPRSPQLWYNAGNAEFRMGNYGHAVYRYRQALAYAPWDSDIRHNLRRAEKKLASSPPLNSPRTLRTQLRDLFSLIPENICLTALLLLWFILFIGFWFFRLIGKPKGMNIFLWTIVLLLVFLFGFTMGKIFWYSHIKEAVILHSEVLMRTEAKEQSPALLTLYNGWRAEIIKEIPDWLFIRTDSGHEGWIRNDEAGVISYE